MRRGVVMGGVAALVVLLGLAVGLGAAAAQTTANPPGDSWVAWFSSFMGGAATLAGALWRFWLRAKLRARKEAQKALHDAVSLVKQHLPGLVSAVRRIEASHEVDMELRDYGVMRTDEKGLCVSVNKTWRRFTGLDLSEAEGNGWVSGVHADDRERIRRAWHACVEDSRPFDEVFNYANRDGVETLVRSLALPIRGADDHIQGWIRCDWPVQASPDAERERLEADRAATRWKRGSSPDLR